MAWDGGVEAHPDLGVFGDPDNREWKQYFLPDSDEAVTGACLVNTVVLRADLRGSLRFGELVAQVCERTLEAQANQAVPFSRLVDALQAKRSLAQTPLFRVMFNFLEVSVPDRREFGNAEAWRIPRDDQTAQFDLTLRAVKTREGLTLSFVYAQDIFEEATIERFSENYLELLRQVVTDGDQFIGEIPLASWEAIARLPI